MTTREREIVRQAYFRGVFVITSTWSRGRQKEPQHKCQSCNHLPLQNCHGVLPPPTQPIPGNNYALFYIYRDSKTVLNRWMESDKWLDMSHCHNYLTLRHPVKPKEDKHLTIPLQSPSYAIALHRGPRRKLPFLWRTGVREERGEPLSSIRY